MCNTDPRSNITKRISQPLRNVMRLFIMVDVDGKMGEQSGQFSPELIPLAIRDMFLPLFCIDVVDEETAKMKLEITSKPIASDEINHLVLQIQMEGFGRAYEMDINKKAENQAKMTKLSMEWKRLCRIKAKVQKKVKVKVKTEESAVKPEPELKNTIGCNLFTHLMGRESPIVYL
ncbi:hypothetical protein Tco_0132742 [Tanacetum coccineum]